MPTPKALLEDLNFNGTRFSEISTIVGALKALLGAGDGGIELYEESWGLMGLTRYRSHKALAEGLQKNGLSEAFAPYVAEELWGKLIEWKPWKTYAFDPVSRIICFVSLAPRSRFPSYPL